MKVFLDDVRTPPKGWTLVRWSDEAIDLLKSKNLAIISLDHDLGNDSQGTGYDVVLWIEEQVAINSFSPPVIKVHFSNTSARNKMLAGVQNINKLQRRNDRVACNAAFEHSKKSH